MRSLLLPLAAALLALITVPALSAPPATGVSAPKPIPLGPSVTEWVGKPAPDFTLADTAGKQHKLSDYAKAKKVVLLEWWDCKCGVVNKYYGSADFVKSLQAGVAKDGIVWLSIDSTGTGKPGSDPADRKKWLDQYGKSNTILLDEDGNVGRAYHANATPTVVVIDTKGKVVYAGAFDQASGPQEAPKGQNLALAAAQAVLAGKKPAVSSTRPFGCAVHYADKT